MGKHTTFASKIWNYRNGAKRRGIEWLLSDDEARRLFASDCYFCGRRGGGIDRLNNELFYSRANAVPCCWTCNRAKGARSAAEFLLDCARITSRYDLRIAHPKNAVVLSPHEVEVLRRQVNDINRVGPREVLHLKIQMSHERGMSERAIASALGISRGKVRRHLARTRTLSLTR